MDYPEYIAIGYLPDGDKVCQLVTEDETNLYLDMEDICFINLEDGEWLTQELAARIIEGTLARFTEGG